MKNVLLWFFAIADDLCAKKSILAQPKNLGEARQKINFFLFFLLIIN
jgi:hypothetical protein|tara:strand:+ start:58 stop:198 length:141 start_codon:yes stop_codon:yes gene_type:complete